MHGPAFWIGFVAIILFLLALDLFIFNRRSHEVHIREALLWSLGWIVLGLAFGVFVWWRDGRNPAIEYYTAYLIEKSLSVDNLFVFALLFTHFQVPAKYQHRVLFWGILVALILRAIMILAGVELIHRFEWMIYVFGAFLIVSGIKMALHRSTDMDPEQNAVLRLARRHLRITPDYHGENFLVRMDGKLFATPLFIVLLLVETTDLVFAVDSIPAVLAISRDPFIVYTSNVFAILGLRALYFALAGVLVMFEYLNLGLSLVLVFVGCKMLISKFYKIPPFVSLGIIAAVLLTAVIASIISDRRRAAVVAAPAPAAGGAPEVEEF